MQIEFCPRRIAIHTRKGKRRLVLGFAPPIGILIGRTKLTRIAPGDAYKSHVFLLVSSLTERNIRAIYVDQCAEACAAGSNNELSKNNAAYR